MKKFQIGLGVLMMSSGLLFSSSMANAEYHESKCKSHVKKSLSILKAFRTLKMAELYKRLDEMDETEGGVSEQDMQDFLNFAPFDDVSDMKKLGKHLNKVGEFCTKDT